MPLKNYICPMHPEVVRSEPGSCPICGMSLVLRKTDSHLDHESMIHDFKKRFWIAIILTIPILLLSPMMGEFLSIFQFSGALYVVFALSTLLYLYGGWPFLKGGYEEIRAKNIGMMTLIGLAITVAYVYSAFVVFGLSGTSFFWELATLIDIMLFGHWIEMKAVAGAGKALEKLAKLLPSTAHKILADGNIQEVPIEELNVKDQILIRPGEKIAADGVVLKGESSVNESLLTGESLPVRKEKDSSVIGGSINGEGSLTVEIQKMGKDSFISQVIEMVKRAQESKSKTQDLANRAASLLTLIALIGGSVTFLIWLALLGETVGFALERTVTVMVITCPHALGLAIPLVVAVSTSLAAQRGLLIRNRAAFELARKVQAIVFDKTGTLTLGEFGVKDVILFEKQMNEEELLNYAGAVERHSEHPIAKAIAARAQATWQVEKFQATPGVGAEGIVQGKRVQIVTPSSFKEKLSEVDDPRVITFHGQGKTVVFVVIENRICGAIALADIIRKESKEAIEKLKKMGIRCLMLTGDNRLVGKWVADEIHLDEIFVEVLPDQKAKKIEEIQSRNQVVAMVGDGINDAPALAKADVGIAIGAGTNIAIETADIILVKSNPLDIVAIVTLAKSTYTKMVQNLLWATGYNVVAIPLAAGILIPFGITLTPALGAVFMSISTIICAINAQLLKIRK